MSLLIIWWSGCTASLIVRVARVATSWVRCSRLVLIGVLLPCMMRVWWLETPFILLSHRLLLIVHRLWLIALPSSRIIGGRLKVLRLLVSLRRKVGVDIYANIYISMVRQGLLWSSMIFSLIWRVVIVHAITTLGISLVRMIILFTNRGRIILSARHWLWCLIFFLLSSWCRCWIKPLIGFRWFPSTISSGTSFSRLYSRGSFWGIFTLLSAAKLTIPAFSFNNSWRVSGQLRILLDQPIIDLDSKFVGVP